MTAPTLTKAEAAVIGRAWNVLARTDEWLAGHQTACAQKVRDYQQWLRDDLDIHDGLLASPASPAYQHPANVYPDLGAQDNATEIAAEWIGRDIADGTGVLILVIGETCGTEAAAFVSGEGGERE